LEDFLSEPHPVVFSGRSFETILGNAPKLNEKYPRLSVISLADMPGGWLTNPASQWNRPFA
jgi:hypothetical protein